MLKQVRLAHGSNTRACEISQYRPRAKHKGVSSAVWTSQYVCPVLPRLGHTDPQKVSLEAEDEPESEEVLTPAAETEKEYAKFLKEMMSRHNKIKVGEQVTLNASYSVIISR
ncbi:hypothetical protein EPI10_031382 [Gossypium australe]|uniref:Uncharacterized protein n=1 Tax=Gossypium australe TaxID=47621 RepID=A0A5B6X1Y6_9ROSI|nr:hypothetical protein EPI10_031382 [Gossypium australe]